MTRAARLLDLLQRLRSHRHPVSGAELAAGLGISLRTLYRDIATLQAQGARIDGAPGLGYLLREGFLLPPLMFTVEELEALSLGTRWVAERGDPRLGAAARDALARIAAVLPAPLRHELDSSALLVGPAGPAPEASGAPAADWRPRQPPLTSSAAVSSTAVDTRCSERIMLPWCTLPELSGEPDDGYTRSRHPR